MNATDTKTYRGTTLAEVLPKIKADLGPDAEIVRQRSGLTGGVGGFFQRKCVEVEARPPMDLEPARTRRRFDAYDDQPAVPEPYEEPLEQAAARGPQPAELDSFIPDFDAPAAEGLTAPGIQEIFRQAAPFAEALGAAERSLEPGSQVAETSQVAGRRSQEVAAPEPAARPPSTVHRPPSADQLQSALTDSGLDSALASEIIDRVVAHELPFASPRSLKRLVRRAVARRIPVAEVPAPGARSIAFVGPGGSGKTLSTARLAAAYASRSDMPVVVISLRPADGGAELSGMLEPLGIGVRMADSGDEARAHLAGAVQHALVVVDTPAVSPRSAAEVAALGAELEALGVGEVHLTLPSTYSAPAARELGELLTALRPAAIALTHMDATTHVGGLLDYAIRAERPISYVADGTGVPGGLEPGDPDQLAGLLLP
jgi:flagellar biosynthesis GTPase FlhF